MGYLDISIGKKFPEIVNAIVEIPKGSRSKYELDKENGMIVLDRVLPESMVFPFNYGFITQTWWEDDDPLDIIIISLEPIYPGVLVEAKVIGALEMEDEKGIDHKVVAINYADYRLRHINDISQIPETWLNEIKHFFEHYKDLEPGKWVKLKGFKSREEGIELVKKAHELYKQKFGK